MPTFLSLVPATSASYPQAPVSRAGGSNETSAVPAEPSLRRSSSSASTTGYRVLKLGPVHWGEHLDEHKEDFYDTAATP
ncbi:hypothetical protein DCS_06601 [Drechmeria coniospora]|uniref:Uncharacterized protein n=1 Tax=Drechmeria coniospora TaxID=98403 RepID=A0A151GC61_DRECN|nr:hypothetical protein DCS_06601 [Drechmeria coniospora]KYK54641.1 hypothetical protein DCS_06601 [Drechmeria coniospora]ODA76135.1 hypothetical protein RJ55_08418 [Drechmeria coniospora]